jgi:uncharacterized protein YidB (DUF937 family)
MSLFTSVVGAVTGKPESGADANPLIGIIGSLLTQSGGLEGLMNKFSQAGLGNVFSSWVSTGPNPPISGQQLQQVLGSDQIKALAAKLGIDPTQASEALAEHLPTVVDKLTPQEKIDPTANIHEGLASLIPSLLRQMSPQVATVRATQS